MTSMSRAWSLQRYRDRAMGGRAHCPASVTSSETTTRASSKIPDGRRADRMAHLSELASRLTPAERAAIATALPALARLVELNRQRIGEGDAQHEP